jgi:hypothetical protein
MHASNASAVEKLSSQKTWATLADGLFFTLRLLPILEINSRGGPPWPPLHGTSAIDPP